MLSAFGLLAGVLCPNELPDVLLEAVEVGFSLGHVVPRLRSLFLHCFEFLAQLYDALQSIGGCHRRPDLLHLLSLLLLYRLFVRLGFVAHFETDYNAELLINSKFVTKASHEVLVGLPVPAKVVQQVVSVLRKEGFHVALRELLLHQGHFLDLGGRGWLVLVDAITRRNVQDLIN